MKMGKRLLNSWRVITLNKDEKYIRKFKCIPAWKLEEEEEWLRKMHLNGYKLIRTFPPFYTFKKCESMDYIYKIGYKILKANELNDYLLLHNDLGWEYVTTHFGWRFFRCEASQCKTTEIYTDSDSKAQIFKEFSVIFIFLVLLIIGYTIYTAFLLLFEKLSFWYLPSLIFLYIECGYFGYKVYKRYRGLKDNKL